jgi:UDP-N-acetylmuramate--alanine ligase
VIVTNIDPEHMEFYGEFDAVRSAFASFVQNIPFYGFGALCIDHPEVQALIPRVLDRKIVTYGLSAQADIRAINIRPEQGIMHYDVVIAGRPNRAGRSIGGIALPMPGLHNVQNTLAAIAVGDELGIPDEAMRRALNGFTGVKRRFSRVGVGAGRVIIDDYGHHPVEIQAVLKGARMVAEGAVVAVVQPHRYTRLRDLFEEFCTCFNEADAVLVADVYPAGETPIAGFDRDSLVNGLIRHGHRKVVALAGPEDLAETVLGLTKSGDMVVCLGAGSITNWAHDLPAALDLRSDAKAREGAGSAGAGKSRRRP